MSITQDQNGSLNIEQLLGCTDLEIAFLAGMAMAEHLINLSLENTPHNKIAKWRIKDVVTQVCYGQSEEWAKRVCNRLTEQLKEAREDQLEEDRGDTQTT